MSTYNGEKFLSEQLDSILNQKNVAVHLEIRDDGSTDNTRRILEEYSGLHDNVKVQYGENVGFAHSFLSLLYEACDADFYAYSDQDDVWYQDKLISAIHELNKGAGPRLYCCAQDVVDEHLNKVRIQKFDRILQYSKYSATTVPPCRGCVQVWNESLHRIIVNNPVDFKRVYSHDAWTFLVAMWDAEVVYDGVPHMAYRQSAMNVMGTYKNSFDRFLYIIKKYYLLCNAFSKELISGEVERLFAKETILTAHYRDSFKTRIKLLVSPKYSKGLDFKWKLFNAFLVLLGRL